MSAQPDPIFAAIERYELAEAECDRIPEADEARFAAALEVSRRARCALAKTAPTTLEGLAVFARFLDRQSSLVLGAAFFDDRGEHLAFYASLNRSLSALSASRRERAIGAVV